LASPRNTTTYGEISIMLDYGFGQPIANPLGPLMRWCAREGLPALTCLVVDTVTGLPKGGLITVPMDKVPAEQQQIYKLPWHTVVPPTMEELRSFTSKAKAKAAA
jgi:hypothetical protein